MTAAQEWNERLAPVRKAARKIEKDRNQGHVCMIIGYNEATDEIAVSDSWGKKFEERWMTADEAEAVSQGGWMAIQF